MIELQGISKTYRVAKRTAGLKQAIKALFHREYTAVAALQNVSFQIAPGEIVGYIGPNGAGKSTTIKVMSGILVPDCGRCNIMGYTPWVDRIAYVKHIGVVFGQRSQLWWDVPVVDSFELLRDIYRVPQAQYRANLELLTATLELSELLTTPVRQLSLGQRMRCEIAASLLHDPAILFLDEPTIGLDAVSKLAVRRFIKEINRTKGVTVILTTHDMNDIEALAQRILLIGKGRLLYDGNLTGLRSRFSSQRTITVDFRENLTPLAFPGAVLLSRTAERAVFSVDIQRIAVSDCIAELARRLDLLDVTVDTPPVEELLVQLYREYRL